MKATERTETIIILELSVDEATWLRNVMQNPLWDGVEEDKDSDYREKFYSSTYKLLG